MRTRTHTETAVQTQSVHRAPRRRVRFKPSMRVTLHLTSTARPWALLWCGTRPTFLRASLIRVQRMFFFFYPIGKRAALCCVSIHCCAFPPTPHPLVSSILCAPLRLFNLCFNALIPQRLAHLFEMILDTTQPWEPAHAELEARCTRGCSLCATRRRRLQWPK